MQFSLSRPISRLAESVAPGFMARRHLAREQIRMGRVAESIRQRDAQLARAGIFPAGQQQQHGARFYAAANPGINRPFAPQLSTPEDYRQAYERIIMIRYGRQMEDDIPYVETILSDFETYVVGDLRYRPDTGNKEADDLICEHLAFRFAECDYARRLDLTGLAKLAVRTKKRDGECGFMYVDTGPDGLKLSAVSADRIGNPLLAQSGANNNFNGIIVDPTTGAPVQFEIWRRLPKVNAYVFDRAVEANQFIHFYDPFRFEQYHGVTAFRSGITRAIDLEQTIGYAIQNIKFRSSQLPAVMNEQGRPKAPGSGYVTQSPNSSGVPQPYQLVVDGVTQSFIKFDEGFVEFPHDFPNANFRDITSDLKGDVALGVHLPPEFCFRSEAGGVLQRFYIEKAQRTFSEEQRLLRRTLLNPFKNRTLRHDIDAGWLNLDKFPGLADSLALYRGTWHMGRSVTTDYAHDTDSDIKLIDANLMSPEEYAADNARDLEEIRQSKKRRAIEICEDAKEVSDKTGMPLNVVLPFIQKQFPNPAYQDLATTSDDGTKPPLISSIGVGGTKAYNDILVQVSTGQLSREAAIETMVHLFGMDRADAEKVVPQEGSAALPANATPL